MNIEQAIGNKVKEKSVKKGSYKVWIQKNAECRETEDWSDIQKGRRKQKVCYLRNAHCAVTENDWSEAEFMNV